MKKNQRFLCSTEFIEMINGGGWVLVGGLFMKNLKLPSGTPVEKAFRFENLLKINAGNFSFLISPDYPISLFNPWTIKILCPLPKLEDAYQLLLELSNPDLCDRTNLRPQ